MTSADAAARTRIRHCLPPLTIILVSVPLVFRLIPRNRWYGVRTPAAMTSDASWYVENQVGGAILIGASLIWLAAATYAPPTYVKPIGITAVLFAAGVMIFLRG